MSNKLTAGDIEETRALSSTKTQIVQLHNYIIVNSLDRPIARVLNITNLKTKSIEAAQLDSGFYLSSNRRYELSFTDDEGRFIYATFKHSSNHGLLAFSE